MAYTVVALHRRSGGWAAQVFRRARAELRSRKIPASQLRFTSAVPGSVDGPIAAVYLASRRAARDSSILSEIAAVEALGAPVVPLVRDGQAFTPAWVPAPIAHVQGLRWQGAGRDVTDYIVTALNLAESDRRVFISYGRRDADGVARQLWARMTERGFDVFLDRFSLRAGQDWARRLDAELCDKSFLIIIESDAAADSEWVQHEVVYALKNHLGVQVITLPGARVDREVRAIPDPFRHRVAPDQLIGRGPARRLRAGVLPAVVSLVERAHDDAVARRRSYLLMSSLDMVRASGCRAVQLPDWTLVAESPTGGGRYLRITARPPRPGDLRRLDAARRRWAGSAPPLPGSLVFEAADLDPTQAELMDWIASDRDLGSTRIQDLPSTIAP